MAGIQFESDTGYSAQRPQKKGGIDLIGMVMRMGIAKDRTQASYVLLTIAVLAIIVGFVFWPGGSSNDPAPLPSPQPSFTR